MRYSLHLLISLFILLVMASHASAIPKVVTTIQPLHSLTSGVMRGVANPTLLIRGGQSPHNYSLRPSDAKALADADLIVWIGAELESFLVKPLENIASDALQLSLLRQSELIRLGQRAGGVWEDKHDHDEHLHDETGKQVDSYNPHLWLDPQNAIRIARLIAKALSDLDPSNSATYFKNAKTLEVKLKKLDKAIAELLSPIQDQPYLVFHDAYPYFEQRYNLNPVGSISVSPDHQTGAKRVVEIRKIINASGARCVFAEPQFKPHLIETIISGSTVESDILDPVGSDLVPGPESYFTLLQQMANSLERCLSD